MSDLVTKLFVKQPWLHGIYALKMDTTSVSYSRAKTIYTSWTWNKKSSWDFGKNFQQQGSLFFYRVENLFVLKKFESGQH